MPHPPPTLPAPPNPHPPPTDPSQFGTIQLEFKYLAHHTGQQKYWDVAQRIMDHMRKVDKPHGLYPVFMSPSSGTWSSQKITLGALGDSFCMCLPPHPLQAAHRKSPSKQPLDTAPHALLMPPRFLGSRSSHAALVSRRCVWQTSISSSSG